ncbi:zinc-dependent alcohol dehydrogenase family protein [Acidihalobacter prosperus]
MKAMVLEAIGQPLKLTELPIPDPGPGQVLLKVEACAVCRTDLHLVDGELPKTRLPIIPGHEIIGRVVQCGSGVEFPANTRLGVPWLGYSCGKCEYCLRGEENLCDQAQFTGYHINGGYAEYTIADARYCFPIDPAYTSAEAAPLMCAGLIGYRSLRLCGDNVTRLGIFGFGAAAHLISQVAIWKGLEIYAFTRAGDTQAQTFAKQLGATWAGDSETSPPVQLDAAIIFAPVGTLVPAALRSVRKGGVVVCGGIHMSDIPAFPYQILWGERRIQSVANLTRRDGNEFLKLAPQVPVHAKIEHFPLSSANQALERLRHGQLVGAAVLVMNT